MQNVVDKTRTQVRMFKKTLRRARSFRAAREKINKEVRSTINCSIFNSVKPVLYRFWS